MIEVELGKRGLLYESLFDIAEALSVPASQLLGGSGPASVVRAEGATLVVDYHG